MLDANGHIIGIHNINTEPIKETLLRPCEVFKAPILANAHAIIVGHNYASGEATPSVDDIEITREFMKNYPDGISQKYHYQSNNLAIGSIVRMLTMRSLWTIGISSFEIRKSAAGSPS